MSDLETVISASIASAEGGGEGGGEGVVADGGASGAESAVAAPEGTEGAAAATPAADPAAATVVAGEQKPARRGPIPFQRHEEILANARAERQAEFDALNKRLETLAQFESQDAKDAVAAIKLMDSDPELFWRVLTEDARYKGYLEKATSGAGAAPAAQPAATAAPTDRPKPDVLNADGSMGYSAEGLEKLLEWNSAQATKAALKQFEERFGPIEQTFHQSAEWNKATAQMKVVLDDARNNWPRFKDFENEIRDKISEANAQRKILPLETAYRMVVIPKLQADRDSMRSELMAELNAKPGAAVKPATRVAPQAAAPAGPRDLESVIAASIAGLQ